MWPWSWAEECWGEPRGSAARRAERAPLQVAWRPHKLTHGQGSPDLWWRCHLCGVSAVPGVSQRRAGMGRGQSHALPRAGHIGHGEAGHKGNIVALRWEPEQGAHGAESPVIHLSRLRAQQEVPSSPVRWCSAGFQESTLGLVVWTGYGRPLPWA